MEQLRWLEKGCTSVSVKPRDDFQQPKMTAGETQETAPVDTRAPDRTMEEQWGAVEVKRVKQALDQNSRELEEAGTSICSLAFNLGLMANRVHGINANLVALATSIKPQF